MSNSHSAGASASRSLPAHIQAQLNSAGGETDTGGQPWKGRNLGEGTSHRHQFSQDDGARDAVIAEVFEKFVSGSCREEDVVRALSQCRVFVPVVAEVSHSVVTDEGLVADKEADMALVSIQAPDGRKALPVFTDVKALQRWHPHARPVAASMRKTALSAVEDGQQLLVVDPGESLTFVVRRPALWALAKGESWAPSYRDEMVERALNELIPVGSGIVRVRTVAGDGVVSQSAEGQLLSGGGAGPELKIVVELLPGLTQSELNVVVEEFQRRLASDELVGQRVDSVQLVLSMVSSS
ncbi:SseB family protein [Rothia sp. P6271]|uniref:SseB family protein n=1 Tax=Rothia sp. P6271 TaxID=3402659 RepID=UPI003AC77631